MLTHKTKVQVLFGDTDPYGVVYFVSQLFEEGEAVFDEIVAKLAKKGSTEWLR